MNNQFTQTEINDYNMEAGFDRADCLADLQELRESEQVEELSQNDLSEWHAWLKSEKQAYDKDREECLELEAKLTKMVDDEEDSMNEYYEEYGVFD